MGRETTVATMADSTAPAALARLQAVRDTRRGRNRIRRLHHHALRTDDMAATRRFYEDLLGMPLVSAHKEGLASADGRTAPFLHCFFEMGDGGCLAFFQFLPEDRGPAPKLPQDGADHHLAMSVGTFGDIVRLREKFEAIGAPSCGIDHGFCYSLYVRDPNGMMVEFVSDAADELAQNEASAASAHDAFATWAEGDHAPNNIRRGTANFPLPTSPLKDILKVISADRES
jgi:glyoxylase I family protein